MVTVYLEPEACLFLSLCLITLPLPWLLSAMLAVLWHEMCHLLVTRLWNGSVSRICIGVTGARIEADMPEGKGRMLSVLAGPAGSLALFLLYSWQPRLAICGLFQGLYNLLPIRPLDGGQLLGFLLEHSRSDYGKWIQIFAESTALLLLFMIGVSLFPNRWAGLALLLPACGRIKRKIPCKPRRFGVQ